MRKISNPVNSYMLVKKFEKKKKSNINSIFKNNSLSSFIFENKIIKFKLSDIR